MPKNISPETERFNFFLEARGLRQVTISKVIGITPSTVSQIVSGKSGISNQVLQALKREYGLNPDWIRTGEGDMLLKREKPPEPQLKRIPVLASIPAGPWEHWLDTYVMGFGEDFIEYPEMRGENLFAIRVKGDSMSPMLNPGDILIIDPHKEFIKGIAVVRHHWGYKIRVVRKLNHRYMLTPYNPAYNEEEIEPDDETRIYVPVKVICSRDL